MKSKIFLTILFLSFTISVFGAKTKTVTIKGEAAIMNKDVPTAKDKAIDVALRRAVEQTTGTIVSSDSLTENFELISDKIYTKSKGYITSYKIVKEGKDPQDNGVYYVLIKAVVSTEKLESDLKGIKAINNALDNPKFLLMIQEQNIGSKTASGWWSGSQISLGVVETTMMKYFLKKGYNFVDHNVLSGKLKVHPAFKSGAVTDAGIKKINNLHDGDYVIYGKVLASVNNGSHGIDFKSALANMTIRVVNIETGKIISIETVEGTGLSAVSELKAGSKSFKNVALKACKKLEKDILNDWKNLLNSARDIKLTVKGLKYKDIRKFKTYLADEIRGVVDVTTGKYKKGSVKFDIKFKGFSRHLADELSNKSFGKLKATPEEVNRSTIVIVLEK